MALRQHPSAEPWQDNSLIPRRSDAALLNNTGLKVDIVEHDSNYQVVADLPGCNLNDLDIQVANNMLHISAKRQQKHEDRTEFSHRIERSFGQVKRSIALPKNAIPDSADARFDNGVLCVQFEKRTGEGYNPKKLQIQSGQGNVNAPQTIAPHQNSNESSAGIPLDQHQQQEQPNIHVGHI
jgi:HSP20 family molecular chaperone IbpA